jgi:hypothetical protein
MRSLNIREQRRWYNMALVDGKVRPNRIRITMSGPFGVGKTSLVRSLLDQAFVPDYDSTEGIEIGDRQLGTLVDFRQAFRKWKQSQPKDAVKDVRHVMLEDVQNAIFEGDDDEDDSDNTDVDPGNVDDAVSATVKRDPPGLHTNIFDSLCSPHVIVGTHGDSIEDANTRLDSLVSLLMGFVSDVGVTRFSSRRRRPFWTTKLALGSNIRRSQAYFR